MASDGETADVVIPYTPRVGLDVLHEKLRSYRFACFVLHRRRGKTTFFVNHLQREALTLVRTGSVKIDDPPQVGIAGPLRVQIKKFAWEPLKRYAAAIPGVRISESELYVEYPNKARFWVFGLDTPGAARGVGFDRLALDEFGEMKPGTMQVIRPMLSDRGGHLYLYGTANGRNQFHKAWIRACEDPEWLAVMHKASETGVIPQDELDRARADMGDEAYEAEYECSFDAAVRGLYWGKEISEARLSGRVLSVPYDPALKVVTAWDLGRRDATAIWFVQVVRGGEVRVIDYYEVEGKGMHVHIKAVQEKPYTYADHIAPHDMGVEDYSAGGKTRAAIARDLGISFRVLPNIGLADGINAGRALLPRCVFDAKRTEYGLDVLSAYRAEVDKATGQLRPEELHDWASHGGAAFRYLALGLQEVRDKRLPKVNTRWVV